MALALNNSNMFIIIGYKLYNPTIIPIKIWHSQFLMLVSYMPDYKKTEQPFKDMEISHPYHEPLAQIDDELFFQKITNPETGEPYLWADLDST